MANFHGRDRVSAFEQLEVIYLPWIMVFYHILKRSKYVELLRIIFTVLAWVENLAIQILKFGVGRLKKYL